ncbi:MAG: hypothetical protein M1816_002938 [Peltula sp. TS41687]|nr:MAG: hypothetical protein M1816_002938 [Peltula sp. TS41687]
MLQRNKDFFGRSDILKTLDTVLLPSQETIVSSEPQETKHVILCGMGGIGKTEVALEFAYSRQSKFDAIFWIRADDVDKLEMDFSEIATLLGLEDGSEPRNLVVSRELAKGWLSNPKKLLDREHDTVGQSEASWLIILDNADNPDILSDHAHIFGSGSWLITSRHPLAKTLFSTNTLAVDLLPLDEDGGAELLQKLTHKPTDAELSRQVAKRLGGLPLAISQMAGIIRRQYLSLSDFLTLYEDDSELKELQDLELEPRQATARGTIASIWAVDQLDPQPRSLLEALVFLDPDCISERLLMENSYQTARIPHWPKKMGAFFSARAELLDRSLVKSNEDKNNEDKKELRIHRVLQDAVRTGMDRTRFTAGFSATVAMLAAVWPMTTLDKKHTVNRWKLCSDLFPHVIWVRDLYEKHFMSEELDCKLQFATLVHEAGWWQHETGNSHAIRPLLELAQVVCETCDKNESRDLLSDIHYGLGAVANETNDGDSCLRHNIEFLSLRLGIVEETGIRDIRLAVAYNQIGTGWMMAENFKEAITSFENALEVYRALSNFSKGMTSVPLANLGLAFWLQGDPIRARKTLEEGLRDREELFGPMDQESFRCGRLLYALGNVKFSEGAIEESEAYHQKALKSFQSTIGVNHHRTADVCHKVAQHLLRRGDSRNALILIDQALKVWGADRTIYKPEIARSSFLKAKILYHLGEEKKASELLKEASTARRELKRSSKKQDGDLIEEDFDELVTFWSK